MNERKRGLVCLFCGEGFGYEGEVPDEATLKAAFDHESICENNPYKTRINELENVLQIAYDRLVELKICGNTKKNDEIIKNIEQKLKR